MWRMEIPETADALGYKKLVDLYDLKTISHFRWSYASPKWEKKKLYFKDQNLMICIYPPSYRLSSNVFEHLEFALKNEGINLFILKKVLLQIPSCDISAYLADRPTGKYARVLWYFYEKFHNRNLPLPDLKQGVYAPLLNPKEYYCGRSRKSSRHRIDDNLLGNERFSPTVRRTSLLQEYEKKQIEKTALSLTKQYDESLIARAMTYLYTKETMSSWEIERERPDQAKVVRFVNLLYRAGSIGGLSEETLVELQKSIVDPRFALNAYRDFQNYVGEEPGLGQMIVHYICPKPEDVKDLMDGLIHSFEIIKKSDINPVIAAAILSFLFVYIHPFEDGNGRVHRFLIHYVLALLKFTPKGIVFPVSAAIARDMHQYDKVLESFSKPLIELITEYTISDSGEMKVSQDTSDFYRYIDCTSVVEYLYGCIDKTIITDFQDELAFLFDYDRIKGLCKEIVDMPDQKVDLFIKCVRQNGGVLSSRKKERYFKMLTEAEIEQMERVIEDHARKR